MIVIWGITLLTKLFYNGLVFGFDYGLYHPDGALYSFRALLMSGVDKVEAGRIVAEWYQENSFKSKPSGPDLYYENSEFRWYTYKPRVLYPLLSVPFVKLFGMPGMLAIPALSYLSVFLATAYIAQKLRIPFIGVLIGIGMSCSVTISRWMFSNTTDSLLLLFTSVLVVLLFRNQTLRLNTYHSMVLLVISILSAMTRFSAIFWLGVVLLLLIHRKFRIAILLASVTVISHIPVFLQPVSGHILKGSSDDSLLGKLVDYPRLLARYTVVELGQLLVLDRVLLAGLVLVLIWSVRNLRLISSQILLISIATLWLTGSIDGTPGVNFRYQIPIIPLCCWVLLDYFSRLKKSKISD
jgi:hypothetical protein